ncbi:hypothetical protein K490DRAFT_56187 [Saccharata proteae CBS 121410]|uniref:Uncharacterized protein n=1 Tax=Saccharata proteae CBS 121410 TaxID=1314787 RepID=A0A9P4HWM1_9PEZI|nr:hypothetical protein K490DRAFT_56187 [Saccharata proteae CBS 121410]
MVPRPTSPTSLLWAHQHKKLEETTATLTSQLHTQHDTQTKLNEVFARISAIETDDEDLRIWIDEQSKERKQSIQEHDNRVGDLALKVELLEEQNKKFDDHASGRLRPEPNASAED